MVEDKGTKKDKGTKRIKERKKEGKGSRYEKNYSPLSFNGVLHQYLHRNQTENRRRSTTSSNLLWIRHCSLSNSRFNSKSIHSSLDI
jgi:hypothetical protein